MRVITVALLFAAGLVLPAAANGTGEVADRQGTVKDIKVFDVLRDGSSIGRHQLVMLQNGDTTEVHIDILLEVGLGPIVLYRYEQENREIWRDGKFVSFHSKTNNDGDDWHVKAIAVENGLALTINGEEQETVPVRMATTYWNIETVRQGMLVGTQEGKVLPIEVTEIGTERIIAEGKEIDATLYQMRGELELDLWYDQNGRWVKLAFELKGSEFDYVLLPPEYMETWTAEVKSKSSGSPEQVQE